MTSCPPSWDRLRSSARRADAAAAAVSSSSESCSRTNELPAESLSGISPNRPTGGWALGLSPTVARPRVSRVPFRLCRARASSASAILGPQVTGRLEFGTGGADSRAGIAAACAGEIASLRAVGIASSSSAVCTVEATWFRFSRHARISSANEHICWMSAGKPMASASAVEPGVARRTGSWRRLSFVSSAAIKTCDLTCRSLRIRSRSKG